MCFITDIFFMKGCTPNACKAICPICLPSISGQDHIDHFYFHFHWKLEAISPEYDENGSNSY